MILSTNLSGILFIDLTANTAGEGKNATANNWLKSQRVTQTLSLVSDTIFNHRGVVTKKLADGLIATFPDASTTLNAVLKIEDQLNNAKEKTGNDTHWRLGLHLAKLHVIAGSVTGEGLEHAVELASQAEGEQILLSTEMAEALTQEALPESIQLVVANEASNHSPQSWQFVRG
jgi:class 3 adenylate cyclase